MPGWQKKFEQYGSDSFTIVGLALDAEGTGPAAKYYERFGVKFPALVDPDYATGFGAVPKTFFISEHGVVLNVRNWEQQLAAAADVRPVTDEIRRQWTPADARLDSAVLADLARQNQQNPADLAIAAELASRYLALELKEHSRVVLERAVRSYEAKDVAQRGGEEAVQLGQAYFQLMRSIENNRERQVALATLSYNLNPSVGFAKQIARIIAPEKFDDRPDGRLDNPFREATYQQLKRQRLLWLEE